MRRMEKSKGERLGWKSVNEYTSVSLKEIVGNGNRVDNYTSTIKKQSMEQMNIGAFKYWLRLKGIRLNQFGTGEKWNPIKVKSKKRR